MKIKCREFYFINILVRNVFVIVRLTVNDHDAINVGRMYEYRRASESAEAREDIYQLGEAAVAET